MRHLALLALIAASAAGRAQNPEITADAKKEVVERVTSVLERSAFVPGLDFKQWDGYLAEARPSIEDAKTQDDFARAVNRAIAKFGASHIVLATPRSANARRTGSMVGIGITSFPEEGSLLITRVVPGGAADKAGLVPGDRVLLVDGKAVEGTKGIPGEEGTTVKLKIRHADGKEEDFDLVRKKFSTQRPVELEFLDDRTVKMSVHSFDYSYDVDRVDSLMKKVRDYPNLVLDLRGNGGGAVINLQHLLSYFLPNDAPIGTMVSRRTVDRYKDATGEDGSDLKKIAAWSDRKLMPQVRRDAPVYPGKVAVLVDRGSGSAAEMAAAALRDVAGAKVLGEKTAGAVLVSVIQDATNGFTLQYPLSDYVTIKGERLEGNGVTPDVLVQEPRYRLPGQKDDTVAKAVELLQGATAQRASSGRNGR